MWMELALLLLSKIQHTKQNNDNYDSEKNPNK